MQEVLTIRLLSLASPVSSIRLSPCSLLSSQPSASCSFSLRRRGLVYIRRRSSPSVPLWFVSQEIFPKRNNIEHRTGWLRLPLLLNSSLPLLIIGTISTSVLARRGVKNAAILLSSTIHTLHIHVCVCVCVCLCVCVCVRGER